MDKKKIIILISSVVVLLVLLYGFLVCIPNAKHKKAIDNTNNSITDVKPNGEPLENVIINEDGVKINVSENINKEKIVVDEFELSNISLKYVDGLTNFSATVKNNSGVDYNEGVELRVRFFDNAGNKIVEVPAVTATLPSGGTSNINARITTDCTSANDISVSID